MSLHQVLSRVVMAQEASTHWMNQLKKVFKSNLVRRVKDVTFEKDKLCGACQAGKQVVNTHPHKNFISTSRPLELLHMDLFGPTSYKSIGGNSYCLVIVDDYSRYTWVLCLQEKSETMGVFKKLANRAQNLLHNNIAKIPSDNSTQFKNHHID